MYINTIFKTDIYFNIKREGYLLTYLCGHNNPIIGVWPALKLPSRRLYFARASTLSNVHVIEELLQLPVGTDTVVIANSYWTKNLAQLFSLEHSQGSGIGI